MSNLNKVMLIGRLGRDPEVRYLENGAAVAKFSIATSESYKDKDGNWQEQTEWHDIILWRLLAERAEQQLKKGNLIYLEGKLTHRKWTDKDGNNRKTTEVVGAMFRILKKEESSTSNYFPNASDEIATKDTNNNAATPDGDFSVTDSTASTESSVEEPADDLPF